MRLSKRVKKRAEKRAERTVREPPQPIDDAKKRAELVKPEPEKDVNKEAPVHKAPSEKRGSFVKRLSAWTEGIMWSSSATADDEAKAIASSGISASVPPVTPEARTPEIDAIHVSFALGIDRTASLELKKEKTSGEDEEHPQLFSYAELLRREFTKEYGSCEPDKLE